MLDEARETSGASNCNLHPFGLELDLSLNAQLQNMAHRCTHRSLQRLSLVVLILDIHKQ